MEQGDTDQLLFSSLQQLGFEFGGKKITSLFEIDGDILRLLCFQFLEFMGSKVTLSSMKGQQKFRQSSKIAEELKNLCGLRIDINSLLSPSKDDLRKILVTLIQKISMHEDGDSARLNISQRGENTQSFETYEAKIMFLREQRRKDILKGWTREEWIHPALGTTRFNSFRCFDQELQLDRQSLRNKLIVQVIDGKSKQSLYSSLIKIIENRSQKTKKEEYIQENFYAEEYEELHLKKHAAQIEAVKVQVAQDFSMANKKKVARLADLLIDQPQKTEEEAKQQLQAEKPTLFNYEIKFQEEIETQAAAPAPAAIITAIAATKSPSPGINFGSGSTQVQLQVSEDNSRESLSTTSALNSTSETSQANALNASSQSGKSKQDDFSITSSQIQQRNKQKKEAAIAALSTEFESLKIQHKQEIDVIVKKQEELTRKMEKYDAKKQKMEESIQQKTEEGEILKEQNKSTKKEIENMELLIRELEIKGAGGSSELKKEIADLDEEIKQIEAEWKEYQSKDLKGLEELQEEIAKKKEKAEIMRDKSKRIDAEYQQLVADIQNNFEKNEKLVEDFKRMPQGSNRQEYVKKITEIKKNYDKQRGDIQKIVKDVKDVEEQIVYYQGTLDRHKAEFEGIYNADTKKNESLSKQIFKIYQEYSSIFEQTANNLREIGNKKIETRAIDAKCVIIATKHYDKSMEKLKQDIDEIKQENIELQKAVKN